MADVIISPNMSLPVPIVGVDPGPQYGVDLNSCLALIDAHDHSAGNGVAITPSGLNINSDLTMNQNDLTQSRSVRFYPQSVALSDPTDIGCLYEVADDLYYNDGSGNQVRITQSGAVAGTPGSIANLVAPATATYVSGSETFVWQSDVNVSASLDARNVILRNSSASSKGLTLSPPNAMGADFSLVLPSLPASQKIMSLDASGNIGAVYGVDNSTIEISANNIQVKSGGITTTQIASNAGILKSQLASLAQQTSAVGGAQTTTSTTFVNMTSMTQTITTSGRPVFIFMGPGTTGGIASDLFLAGTPTGICVVEVQLLRGATVVGKWGFGFNIGGSSASSVTFPTNFVQIDPVSAGTYTYQFQFRVTSSGMSVILNSGQTTVYEL